MLDITERKRGEDKLQESRDYLDKIINSIGDPIFVKNRRINLFGEQRILCIIGPQF